MNCEKPLGKLRCASTCSTTMPDILVQSPATCQLVFAFGGPNKRGAGSYFDAFGSQFVLLLSVSTFWSHALTRGLQIYVLEESECFLT